MVWQSDWSVSRGRAREGRDGPSAVVAGQQVALCAMPEPRFRFVCLPSALAGTPAGWARDMLEEGEVALLASDGLDAINQVAHELGQIAVALVRTEQNRERQDRAVMAYADSLPLVWVAADFSDEVRAWAHERGPMTLLSEADGSLGDEERRRIDRFLAILGRQSE
jgi:hypothetical protein